MKLQKNDTKQQLIKRLRRIEGQVRGVQVMLDEERDCREIMQQLQAVHAAVQSTSRVFLQDYAALCLAGMRSDSNDKEQTRIINDMMALMGKTP